MRRSAAIGLMFVVLAVLLAGCGKTAPQSSRAAPAAPPKPHFATPAEASFASRAEAICKVLNDEITRSSVPKPTTRDLVHEVPNNVVREQRSLRQLEALRPLPQALAVGWRQMLAYRRILAQELDQLSGAAKAGNTRRIQAFAASKLRVHAKLRNIAAKNKFVECGQVG